MRVRFPTVAMVAGILIVGVVGPDSDAGAQGFDLQKLKDLIGNQNFDPSKMPTDTKQGQGAQKGLEGISSVVSETKDCAAASVRVTIPKGWQCRKINDNAEDFTLYTDNNTLNLTIGLNQGKSSCDVLPTCTRVEKAMNLGTNFVETRELIQPMLGSVEIVATYARDPKIKLLITSNNAISEKEREDILAITESLEKK